MHRVTGRFKWKRRLKIERIGERTKNERGTRKQKMATEFFFFKIVFNREERKQKIDEMCEKLASSYRIDGYVCLLRLTVIPSCQSSWI